MNGVWAVIAGMAFVTCLPRVIPLIFLPGMKMPKIVEKWLSLIAPATLAALLPPELAIDGATGAVALSIHNVYLAASIPALLAGLVTKSLFATVTTGMAAVALIRLLA
ncbi:MAG: AzlD domain-containing protein [Synergistaceae bacterium]|nr:AzlD domain-containing protein [Synergistaceae bacterium]